MRREEKQKIKYTNWTPIRIMEATPFLLETHNRKFPGSDKIPDY
jgi:hypothetical protein